MQESSEEYMMCRNNPLITSFVQMKYEFSTALNIFHSKQIIVGEIIEYFNKWKQDGHEKDAEYCESCLQIIQKLMEYHSLSDETMIKYVHCGEAEKGTAGIEIYLYHLTELYKLLENNRDKEGVCLIDMRCGSVCNYMDMMKEMTGLDNCNMEFLLQDLCSKQQSLGAYKML